MDRRCCCQLECYLWHSDFSADTTPETDIGLDMAEREGDWVLDVDDCEEADDPVLVSPGETGSLVQMLEYSTTGKIYMEVIYCTENMSSSAIPRIYIGLSEDGTEYCGYIEIEYEDVVIYNADDEPRARASEALVDIDGVTMGKGMGWSEGNTFLVCITENMTRITTSHVGYDSFTLHLCNRFLGSSGTGTGEGSCDQIEESNIAYIGLGDGADVSYGTRVVQLWQFVDVDEGCPDCCPRECGTVCPPVNITMRIYSEDENCENWPGPYPGIELPLYWNTQGIDCQSMTPWDEGSEEPCLLGYFFWLRFNSDSEPSVQLYHDEDGGCSTDPLWFPDGLTDPDLYTCDPFYARWTIFIEDEGSLCDPADSGWIIVEVFEGGL